jgi:hypothetical protein
VPVGDGVAPPGSAYGGRPIVARASSNIRKPYRRELQRADRDVLIGEAPFGEIGPDEDAL